MPEKFTGKVDILNSKGTSIFTIDPDSGFVQIVHKYASSTKNVIMQITNTGSVSLVGSGNDWGARLDGTIASLFLGCTGKPGKASVRNGKNEDTIVLDGHTGDIVLANADCAEDFDLEFAAEADPGTVMVLGEDGALRASSVAYDKTVVGVVSGAGEFKPALVLDRRPSDAPRVPLALVGKTYCKVAATNSGIEVGDLLTTSSTPGHAMKATDPMRAFGAVIGKALRPLRSGTGLIPILVALQ